MRTVFLSFSGLIRRLVDGTVRQDQLDAGIFYFGCVREYVFDPSGHPEEYDDLKAACRREDGTLDGDLAASVHARIVAALRSAETDGRAAYRLVDEERTYAVLNALLAKQDLPQLTEMPPTDRLQNLEVRRVLSSLRVPIDVICW